MRVWPRGCVCHAARAPGSNVTRAPPRRLLLNHFLEELPNPLAELCLDWVQPGVSCKQRRCLRPCYIFSMA
jgi:hypothetical protein